MILISFLPEVSHCDAVGIKIRGAVSRNGLGDADEVEIASAANNALEFITSTTCDEIRNRSIVLPGPYQRKKYYSAARRVLKLDLRNSQ